MGIDFFNLFTVIALTVQDRISPSNKKFGEVRKPINRTFVSHHQEQINLRNKK